MLKAIETKYQGCRFRSRLEARWAVFWDALGVPWSYEPEGYDLDGVLYLPDFWLPTQQMWVEIKGNTPTLEERHKALLLAREGEHPVVIFSGSIACGVLGGVAVPSGFTPDAFVWGECSRCQEVNLIDLDCFRQICCCGGVRLYRLSSTRLRAAYDAARSARFEHGEMP